MKAIALLAAALVLQTPQATPSPQNEAAGTLEGLVLRDDNGAPIAGALVSWTSSLDPPRQPNRPPTPNGSTPATTGSDGKFTFKDLRPAGYRLSVAANGYIPQEYGQKVQFGQGREIDLSAGQTVKGLLIPLTRTAILTGRILTDTGQPAVDNLVQLVGTQYAGGYGKIIRGFGAGNADGRGEFRINDVRPGRYYLVAGTARVTHIVSPGSGDASVLRVASIPFDVTFFPGVPDMGSATLIELKPGSETKVDITVKSRQQTYRVSGRIVTDGGAAPPSANSITLVSQFSPQGKVQASFQGRNSGTSPGTFEFLGVPPGSWTVQAEIPIQTTPTAPGQPIAAAQIAARNNRPQGQTSFDVKDANVEGLVITLRTGFTIPGRISVEGGQPISAVTNLNRMAVAFTAGSIGAGSTAPAADGTFELTGAREGEYQVSVRAVPEGYYLKAVRYGGEDLLGKPFRLSRPAAGTVEVILCPGPGQVSGMVTDAQSKPVSGVEAALIPEQPQLSGRYTWDLYKTVVTDRNGRFAIQNIQPGTYRLFSWDAIEPFGYLDPELMKQYESQGKSIRIEESSNATIDLKLIPAR